MPLFAEPAGGDFGLGWGFLLFWLVVSVVLAAVAFVAIHLCLFAIRCLVSLIRWMARE